MSTRTYQACLKPVSEQHGPPELNAAFLDTIVDTIQGLPDEVFKPNPYYDIYSVMNGVLGPYEDLTHRKAVMCEVLRVVAAFESDWNWNAGVDKHKPAEKFHPESEETGAFQVSWDSVYTTENDKNETLRACAAAGGATDAASFIRVMKANHKLAVEYCARLFRFSVGWCGTVKDRNMVVSHVSRKAVAEFRSFLAPALHLTELAGGSDAQHINRMLQIAKDPVAFEKVRQDAGVKLWDEARLKYPTDACAITLTELMQHAGIAIKDELMALGLTNILHRQRGWQVIPNGQQQPGDVGTTCHNTPTHNADHIYLVVEVINKDEMLVADNQEKAPKPHTRFVSGKGGKTPTLYFLRAV